MGFAEIYIGDRLVKRGTLPLSFSFTKPENFEIVIMFNGFQWVRDYFLKPGREYFIGVPGMEEYIAHYNSGRVNTRITYIMPIPYGGTVVIENQPDCVFMDPYEFNALLESIREESFSDDKLEIIRHAAAGHCFSVSQAKTLIREFEFDDDKLTAAKILADALLEPQDAYMLAKVFTYSDTKEEYLNWLRR